MRSVLEMHVIRGGKLELALSFATKEPIDSFSRFC